MTGPTRHYLHSTEVIAIDRVDHLDHLARDLFFRRIGVPLRIRATRTDMTVSTTDAEGGRKKSHRSHELVHGKTLQRRNVLEDLLRHWRFRSGWSAYLRKRNGC